MPASDAVLTQILAQLEAMQIQQQTMQAQLDAIASSTKPQTLLEPVKPPSEPDLGSPTSPVSPLSLSGHASPPSISSAATKAAAAIGLSSSAQQLTPASRAASDKEREKLLYPGRINLSTYPDQHGIDPYPLNWDAQDPQTRGPVICSRLPSSIKHRNAIGAHSGSYSIYRSLSIALGALSPSHKPDYNLTEPPVSIPPQPSWSSKHKIVSFDPWGHLVPQVFRDHSEKLGLDVRPSIAVTKAHMKLSELDEAARRGDIEVDGKLVLESRPVRNPDGSENKDIWPGVEVAISKAAVEPVWYLPGVAERFGISESLLRRALFEETGGMYPELITRPDIKVFLPPIGNLTVYIFGNPAYVSDPDKELTLRVHDECNGSDVFGSDICTCKPYLVFAIEECIRCVHRGGVGVVVYFRKEGRALGEVTKYLVYNLRKRGGDSADRYFKSTEMIAGVKDMRFQALMPDVLHWLGITKVDNMISMSDMKYDAIVKSGIEIKKRYDIPDHLIPPDSRVEIDAKIAAGYFSSGKKVTQEDLVKTVGRTWEETEH
ncbi:cyclohydrolase [Amanita muscaria]|uniref:GTP cyclohydrolase II n=1 Tax=Amanita muscaria (strain Koide BX008) TaxID=946122 RepID=A0A0C2XDG4_AMAMK|nr:hypothetical protein M378DRAFT_74629 [Amanita muscaria Koide BX008]